RSKREQDSSGDRPALLFLPPRRVVGAREGRHLVDRDLGGPIEIAAQRCISCCVGRIAMPELERLAVLLRAGSLHSREPVFGALSADHRAPCRERRIAPSAFAICFSTPFTLIPCAAAISS